MRITWYGHSAFRLDYADKTVLIDPFLTGNPSFGGKPQEVFAGVTHCVITHGHSDHTGDVMELAAVSGPTIFANYEICVWLSGKGIAHSERLQPMNTGGGVSVDGIRVSLVRADHSSSQDGVPLGNANGAIIEVPGQPTVWHMGDTDVFSDMRLICDLYRPAIAIVPIGDRFTMGPDKAAFAIKTLLPGVEHVIPCHYATFAGMLEPDASRFVAACQGAKADIHVLKSGGSVDF